MLNVLLAFLPLTVCTFWSLVLFLEYLDARSAVRLRLLIFMVVAALLYAGHFVFFVRALWLMPLADTVYGMCNLAVYPLFLFYVVQLTRGRIQSRLWLTLLPSLLAGMAYFVLYLLMGDAERMAFIDNYLYRGEMASGTPLLKVASVVHTMCKVLFAVLVVLTFWYGNRCLSTFRMEVKQTYADIDGRMLQPIRKLLLLFLVTSFVSFIFNILGRQLFEDSIPWLTIPSLLFSMLLFGLGYVGSHPLFSHIDLRIAVNTETTESSESDVQKRIEEVAQEIERLMEEEHFYLNSDLHVEDVARRIGTNVKYVSLALNQIMGVTFSDYVNCRRIAYACELQRQQPGLPMTEIAHRSGYMAMPSFYRNMKRWGNKG